MRGASGWSQGWLIRGDSKVGKPLYTAQQFLEAIPGTGGIVTAIARKVGCDWSTAKKYIERFATVQRAYQDECESILDLAEAKVISAIKDGDSQMIRYYLSTKGKNRGYSDRHEITGKGGNELVIRYVNDWRDHLTEAPSGPEDGAEGD